jgi:hypothetical protein
MSSTSYLCSPSTSISGGGFEIISWYGRHVVRFQQGNIEHKIKNL